MNTSQIARTRHVLAGLFVTFGVICLIFAAHYRSAPLLLIAALQGAMAATYIGGEALPSAGQGPAPTTMKWLWAHRGQPRVMLYLIGFVALVLVALWGIVLMIQIWEGYG